MFKFPWNEPAKPDPTEIKYVITSQQKVLDTQKKTINSLHAENKRLIGIIEKLLEREEKESEVPDTEEPKWVY